MRVMGKKYFDYLLNCKDNREVELTCLVRRGARIKKMRKRCWTHKKKRERGNSSGLGDITTKFLKKEIEPIIIKILQYYSGMFEKRKVHKDWSLFHYVYVQREEQCNRVHSLPIKDLVLDNWVVNMVDLEKVIMYGPDIWVKSLFRREKKTVYYIYGPREGLASTTTTWIV